MEVYKPIIKKFLGKDVRVVQVGSKEYIVLKDIFNCLGRLDEKNQITSRDRQKLNRLLNRIKCDSTKCTITSKSNKSKSRETQSVTCIPIEKLSMVTVQFEPKSSDKELNEIYDKFILWVDNLLMEAKY